VEGMTFVCESVGVSAAWTEDYDRVTVRGNWFVCSVGIGVARSRTG